MGGVIGTVTIPAGECSASPCIYVHDGWYRQESPAPAPEQSGCISSENQRCQLCSLPNVLITIPKVKCNDGVDCTDDGACTQAVLVHAELETALACSPRSAGRTLHVCQCMRKLQSWLAASALVYSLLACRHGLAARGKPVHSQCINLTVHHVQSATRWASAWARPTTSSVTTKCAFMPWWLPASSGSSCPTRPLYVCM